MPDFQTIINALVGSTGALALLVYIGWTGQKGNWLFKGVHDAIVIGYEKRLAEKDVQIAQALDAQRNERERGDKWQAIYLQSRNVIDKSVTVAESAVTGPTMPLQGGV